jgi:hypothetical protein
LLQKHIALCIENKDAESPMQKRAPVRFHFLHRSKGGIVLIDQDHLFLLLHVGTD